jgi:hypothetical protein
LVRTSSVQTASVSRCAAFTARSTWLSNSFWYSLASDFFATRRLDLLDLRVPAAGGDLHLPLDAVVDLARRIGELGAQQAVFVVGLADALVGGTSAGTAGSAPSGGPA